MNESINWKKTTLGSISLIKGQYGANKPAVSLKEGNARYIRITDIDDDGQLINEGAVGANIEKIEQYSVNYNDLLFVRTGATTGKCYIHRDHIGVFTFAGFLIKFKIDESKADPYYIWSITKTKKYIDWVKTMSVRSGQPGINSKEYSNLELMLPPLKIQKKITQILSNWDEAINLLSNLLSEISNKKKAISDRLYRGLASSNKNEITYKRLKKHIKEVSVRNKSNIVNNVLSVSNSQGFIPQDQQFDREIASKDRTNYKIINRHQFAYNPSRVNVGSIDLLENHDNGLLSPMYIVFECLDTIDYKYLYHFLKSDLFLKLVPKHTQGSVRDSLSFSGLGSMKIYLPSIEEQTKYAKLLDSIDEEYKLIEDAIELYNRQKQGLMQQLLTGKISVTTSREEDGYES